MFDARFTHSVVLIAAKTPKHPPSARHKHPATKCIATATANATTTTVTTTTATIAAPAAATT